MAVLTSGFPFGWTTSVAGGATVEQETADVREGGSAARVNLSGAGAEADFERTEILEVGGLYRLAGAYKPVTDGGGASLRVFIGDGSSFLLASGRDYAADSFVEPQLVEGEWRRFSFDVLAFASSSIVRLRVVSTGAAGHMLLDDCVFPRIYRFEPVPSRLRANSIPALESGANDLFFGGLRIGSGKVAWVNADGFYNEVLGNLEWRGSDVAILAGGVFADGQEILLDNMRPRFVGMAQRISADDDDAQLAVRDFRQLFRQKLPRRTFRAFNQADLDTRFEGKVRRLLAGRKTNLTPVRVDLAGEYGIYEICDLTDAPNGMKSVDAVHSYTDEAAADERLTAKRITLAAGSDYSDDLDGGRVSILKDVQVLEIVSGERDRLDFNIGAGSLAAELDPGRYTPSQLAAQFTTKLTDKAATTVTATYDESTHKGNVSGPAGLDLELDSSAANRDRSAWPLFGFTASTNKSGASVDGDEAIFENPDVDQVLRVDAQGMKDDASGTYTGTASALIELGPDLFKLVWRRFLRLPLEQLDGVSFTNGRTSNPELLAFYLTSAIRVGELIQRLGFSNNAAYAIGADGRAYFQPYTNAVEADAPHLEDSAFLTFRASRPETDIYSEVRINCDASTGEPKQRAFTDDAVRLEFERSETRDFESFLVSGDVAQARINQFGALGRAGPLVLEVTTSTELLDRREGQKVRVTRANVPLAPGGALDSALFRIVTIRPGILTDQVGATLVEHVDL